MFESSDVSRDNVSREIGRTLKTLKPSRPARNPARLPTANPRTNIVEFGGFDSNTILILRSGLPRPKGDFPESLTQAMLAGATLVGQLNVILSLLLLAITKSINYECYYH